MKVSDIDVAKKLLSIAASAADRGIEFDLSFNKMKKLMEQKKCYYTGIEFEETGKFARSIDRVDNSKGYVDSNVVAANIYINGKKKDLSIEEINLIFKKVLLHTQKAK